MRPAFTDEFHRRSAKTLDTALDRVSAYRAWEKHDPGPHVHSEVRYPALPVLTKDDLRAHTWRGFVPNDLDADRALAQGEIELVQTSGTTSERVVNVWHQKWWDASEKLSWTYNSATTALELGEHREAILTSPHNTGRLSEARPLSREERTLGRFLYLNERSNPAGWDEGLCDRMLAELSDFKPVVLEANPNYLARLSRYAFQKKKQPYQPPVIVLTYENPSPLCRKLIRLSFDAPLASSYGSTEAGYVFMECEEGRLHQNSESCRIDFEPLKPEHGGPDLGRIFVTTFDNPWRILVRFDIGDLVRLAPHHACACGRDHGYTALEVAGRTANLTFTTDGRALVPTFVEAALVDVPGLSAFSVVQQNHLVYETVIETYGGVNDKKTEGMVRDRLVGLYGNNADVRVSVTPALSAGPSGKYRFTRALFSFDEDALFVRQSTFKKDA